MDVAGILLFANAILQAPWLPTNYNKIIDLKLI